MSCVPLAESITQNEEFSLEIVGMHRLDAIQPRLPANETKGCPQPTTWHRRAIGFARWTLHQLLTCTMQQQGQTFELCLVRRVMVKYQVDLVSLMLVSLTLCAFML